MFQLQEFDLVQRLAQDVAHETFDNSDAPLADIIAFASDELSGDERQRLAAQLKRISGLDPTQRRNLLDDIGWIWEADSDVETSALFLDLALLCEGADEVLADP